MFLAFREMRRSKVRFAFLIGAVALLALLILFQTSLQNALIRQFVGGVRNQSAPVLVFDVDGRRITQASVITPDLGDAVRDVDGIRDLAPIWASTFPVRAGGMVRATSVIGYEQRSLGGPTTLRDGRWPARPGEVIANASDGDLGYGIGSEIKVARGGPRLTVVGTADDIGINVQPTIFAPADTYLDVLQSRNPEIVDPPPNVLGVVPREGLSPSGLAGRINAADPNLDALDRDAAANRNPGVESIRQSFNVIFILFALVVPLVTGLFFLILTLQKAPSLTLLRALGASTRRLIGALMVQVLVVLGAGMACAVAVYFPLTQQRLNDLSLQFETRAVVVWTAVLATLGALSALASARRVLAIDPLEATTGAGARA